MSTSSSTAYNPIILSRKNCTVDLTLKPDGSSPDTLLEPVDWYILAILREFSEVEITAGSSTLSWINPRIGIGEGLPIIIDNKVADQMPRSMVLYRDGSKFHLHKLQPQSVDRTSRADTCILKMNGLLIETKDGTA